jgi:hypothetical protein
VLRGGTPPAPLRSLYRGCGERSELASQPLRRLGEVISIGANLLVQAA